jgi:hypothetical protein
LSDPFSNRPGLLCAWLLIVGAATTSSSNADDVALGPLVQEFRMTLKPGDRTEAVGPFYGYERTGSERQVAIPPFYSRALDEEVDAEEVDILYPLLSYDRFGSEYRFHIAQVFSFAGGNTQNQDEVSRFTLFPIYFQERSKDPARNYTAVFPFYGKLKNRLFRDEADFALWPLYSKTKRRARASPLPDDPFLALPYRFFSARRGDITTYNMPYPIFHLRFGEGLYGWQVWPLVGNERKEVITRTNQWGELQVFGGHEEFFLFWPFYANRRSGIGTENPEHQQALLPFYSYLRSPLRDSTTYLWPLGLTITDDRARKYHEVGAPWPLIVFTRGEGKTVNRVWPFFSRAYNANLESSWLLWPLYKYNRIHSRPVDRERTRIMFFLYSDRKERNTETGTAWQRTELWPLFNARRDHDGNERLQILSPIEPFVPNSKSIERNYSPLWSIWRSEKNPRSGASSQSALWNLYRYDSTPESKKCSLLFGLFQYHSGPDGKRVRVFYIPFGKARKPSQP